MMQRTMRTCVLGLVVWASAIGGCTAIPPKGASDTLPTGPFFMAEPDELGMLQAISKAQEARIKACQKGQPCEDASYLRGLVALFENRADAMSTFQGLHNTMPTSRYDAAIVGWIDLLQDQALASPHSRALMMQLKEEVLHTLTERSTPVLAKQGKKAGLRPADLRR